MVTRRGSAARGCLTLVLFVAVAGYVAINVGEPYFRFFRFRDAASQEARFGTLHTDAQIQQALWSVADSLNLPEAAYHFRVTRGTRGVRIHGSYDDRWTLLRYTRPVHFVLEVTERP